MISLLYFQFNIKKVIMVFKQMCVFGLICVNLNVFCQTKFNYNEDAIKPYVLPELLILNNGAKVQTVEDWENKRRPEIMNEFRNEIYGNIPAIKLIPISIEILEQSNSALNNTAIRKQIAIVFANQDKQIKINVLLYLPKNVKSPPVFVGYNFFGNHSTINDKNVILTDSWVRNNSNYGVTENRAKEESRGKRKNQWLIERSISEGFGVATIHHGDIDPNRNDFSDGIHPFFYEEGQEKPKSNEWGSISAWAWGLSRVLDYLKTDEHLIDSKFILFGNSLLGKTALWAGALDKRFDIVISNNSGCGGAAIFRRRYGETIARINNNHSHWFSENFKKYNDNEDLLPIDQHMLIALIAPRPVYIASAEEDKWADPKGEYLSGHYATPLYELYKKKGLVNPKLPSINRPIHNTIGYHIRTGKHDVSDYDWLQFIKFTKKHLKKDKIHLKINKDY